MCFIYILNKFFGSIMVEFYCFYRYSLIKILNSIQAETIVTLHPGCDMIQYDSFFRFLMIIL
jgi:hypothetical protein